MKTIKLTLLNLFILVVVVSVFGGQQTRSYLVTDISTQGQDTTKWIAPDDASKIANPIVSNETTIAEGMNIYRRNCRSCHGKLGDGKGVESEDLTIKPPDFRQASLSEQTDGALFWKINTGRNDMASYSKDLTPEEIWKVTLYIRTFSK